MRQHLLRRLEQQVLSMFPKEKTKRGRVDVYCHKTVKKCSALANCRQND